LKRTHLAAILASLALVLPACGGGDEKDSSAPAAAGTSPAAEAEQPSESAAPEESNPPADPQNGDGGSSAADAQRAAGDGSKQETAAAPRGGSSGKEPKPAAKRKARTPQEQLASLSPAERRKLEHDLYEQGKEFCYAYGPKLLAKEYKFPTTDPETVARLYARLYEAAAPSLALPYQQGCLAGFKRFQRNPPKTPGN
jgi:hypothetical protein